MASLVLLVEGRGVVFHREVGCRELSMKPR
jgi:hypothetical protein